MLKAKLARKIAKNIDIDTSKLTNEDDIKTARIIYFMILDEILTGASGMNMISYDGERNKGKVSKEVIKFFQDLGYTIISAGICLNNKYNWVDISWDKHAKPIVL